MAQPFPWDEAMAFGLGTLRHSPTDFWSMTPRELRSAIDGVYGRREAPLTRDALATLMLAYPDN